jgi:nucleolar complex protein 3
VIERRDAVVTPPQSDISEDESDNLEDQLGNQSTAEKNASNTEPRHSIKSLSFHDKRQSIGDIACKILANPEDSLDQFKRLRAFHKDASPKIVIIAILTELAIFRDILPGYRIRQLTDKEKTVKVSYDYLVHWISFKHIK